MSEFTVNDDMYISWEGGKGTRINHGFIDTMRVIGISTLDWKTFLHLRFFESIFKDVFITSEYLQQGIDLAKTMFPNKIFDFDKYWLIDRDLEYIVMFAPLDLDMIMELEEN